MIQFSHADRSHSLLAGPAHDETACGNCGAYIYHDLLKCPNRGVYLIEPNETARESHPAEEFPLKMAGALREAALFDDLLRQVGSDRSVVERLIENERGQKPNAMRLTCLQNAIRWGALEWLAETDLVSAVDLQLFVPAQRGIKHKHL